jgi:hypothetical protein
MTTGRNLWNLLLEVAVASVIDGEAADEDQATWQAGY